MKLNPAVRIQQSVTRMKMKRNLFFQSVDQSGDKSYCKQIRNKHLLTEVWRQGGKNSFYPFFSDAPEGHNVGSKNLITSNVLHPVGVRPL